MRLKHNTVSRSSFDNEGSLEHRSVEVKNFFDTYLMRCIIEVLFGRSQSESNVSLNMYLESNSSIFWQANHWEEKQIFSIHKHSCTAGKMIEAQGQMDRQSRRLEGECYREVSHRFLEVQLFHKFLTRLFQQLEVRLRIRVAKLACTRIRHWMGCGILPNQKKAIATHSGEYLLKIATERLNVSTGTADHPLSLEYCKRLSQSCCTTRWQPRGPHSGDCRF